MRITSDTGVTHRFCNFCGRHVSHVAFLLRTEPGVDPEVCICDICIDEAKVRATQVKADQAAPQAAQEVGHG